MSQHGCIFILEESVVSQSVKEQKRLSQVVNNESLVFLLCLCVIHLSGAHRHNAVLHFKTEILRGFEITLETQQRALNTYSHSPHCKEAFSAAVHLCPISDQIKELTCAKVYRKKTLNNA